MKKMMSSFSDSLLSREQMKNVKGGDLTCNYNYYLGDGVYYETIGSCAGNSLEECQQMGAGTAGGVTVQITNCY